MKVKTKEKELYADQLKLSLPRDYPWKVLGWLTQDLSGQLDPSDFQLLSQIIRDRDFHCLQLLAEEWGLQIQSMLPLQDQAHISTFRAKYQLAMLLKKFRFETDKDKRLAAAKEKFFSAEAACQAYNHGGFKALSQGETETDACVFTHAKGFLRKLLGGKSPSKEIVTLWSRHGPGSNLDTSHGQSNTYFKYANWPYSCTSAALPYAIFLIQSDKRWLGALENSYRERYNIPKYRILDQEVFWANVLEVVEGNRIAFVPKNAQTERTIAIEPAMNLVLQLGVDGVIRQRLKRWGVDLDSQEKNQEFARLGSKVFGPESFSTLDLSAASDTISLKVAELLLPEEWYSYLLKLRSPKGKMKGAEIVYQKISSMGNGYTFALESAIFTALIYGVIKTSEGSCNTHTDFCVFGDDLIVKQKHVTAVVRALNNAGFKLNLEKSFVQGYIKESCGTDWVHGMPVRPVFFTDTPVNVLDLFVDINRLQRILVMRWGITDSICVRNMKRWVPEIFRQFTGPCSDTEFHSYLHTPNPTGKYENCLWKYPVLTYSLSRRKGKDFFFRKLMHDLRGTKVRPSPYVRKNWKVDTGGKRFTVYRSYSYVVRPTYSVADYWRSNYNSVVP